MFATTLRSWSPLRRDQKNFGEGRLVTLAVVFDYQEFQCITCDSGRRSAGLNSVPFV